VADSERLCTFSTNETAKWPILGDYGIRVTNEIAKWLILKDYSGVADSENRQMADSD